MPFVQKITDIALSGKAPKTVWGIIAAICLFLDANPDQLNFINDDFRPTISFFVKIGAIGAAYVVGVGTRRPSFMRKDEEEAARKLLESNKPKPKKPTRKVAKKTVKKKVAAKKTTKKYAKKK